MKLWQVFVGIIGAIAVVVIATYSWMAHGNEWVSKVYPISDVTHLVAGGGCIMTISQGTEDSLRIDGKAETLERISVDQTGSKLTLRLTSYTRDTSISNLLNLHNDQYRYILQLKDLQRLDLEDACIANIGDWVGKKLAVHASSASKVEFAQLKLEHFFIEQHNASRSSFETLTAAAAEFRLANASKVDVHALGEVDSVQLLAGHASHFDGKLLRAQHAQIEADHASNVAISVAQTLDAKASYASDVDYWGSPKTNIEAMQSSKVNAHSAAN